jgi:hypothetical protein
MFFVFSGYRLPKVCIGGEVKSAQVLMFIEDG